MLTETENIDHELALTIFTQKALKFENLTLFYEFGGVFYFHNNSNHRKRCKP